MTLEELMAVLLASPSATIQLVLPDGSSVPAHFHVTEVGRVQKDFIDCGGVVRRSTTCVMQAWVANDITHRIDAAKLTSIAGRGATLFETTAIPLEVEYDNGVISQYPVERAEVSRSGVVLYLGTKHTACLAPDRCGITLDVLSLCSAPGCCVT